MFQNNYNGFQTRRKKVISIQPVTNKWLYNVEEKNISEVYIKKSIDNTINKIEEQDKIKQVQRCGIICIKKDIDYKNYKFLVVRGKCGQIWSFPKGSTQENETSEECAKREFYEETGLKISTLDTEKKCKLGRNIYFIIDIENTTFKINEINLINTIDHYNFEIRDQNEIDKVEWKTFSELKANICNKDIRLILNYPEKIFSFHSLIYTKQEDDLHI